MSSFRTLRSSVVVVAVLTLLGGSARVLAQKDAAAGTWTLNVAKSTYEPGPAPKSSTLVIEAMPNGVKVSATGVGADGKPSGTEYTASYDGKDYPVKLTGSQAYDSLNVKRVDALKVEGTRKKAGKVVQTYSRVVSKDGKTLTVTSTSAGDGPKLHNVVVYDRK
jgi:hypothetical protein